MNLVGFQKLRSGFQVNAIPAAPAVLVEFERRLRKSLERSVTFDHVEVEISDDPNRLLVGLVTYDPSLAEAEVSWTLEHLWNRLGFDHWEAHAFLVQEGHVELQAGTLDGRGHYVTLHMVAQAVVSVPGTPVAGRESDLETTATLPAQRSEPGRHAAGRRRRLLGV